LGEVNDRLRDCHTDFEKGCGYGNKLSPKDRLLKTLLSSPEGLFTWSEVVRDLGNYLVRSIGTLDNVKTILTPVLAHEMMVIEELELQKIESVRTEDYT
jgi:hypothetical protein